MFSFLTDSIENALTVAGNVMCGEDVSKRQVAKLLSDGVSVAAIAAGLGLAVDVVERMIED